MLIEFSIENFRSFKEKVSFSLLSSNSDHSLSNNLIPGDRAIIMGEGVSRNSLGKGNDLLKGAVIYGANASGKSNLLRALDYLRHIIISSAQNMPGDEISFDPFRLDARCLNKPCKFDIDFIYENVRYNYGASFTAERVIEEYLYYYPKGSVATIFERTDTNDYKFTSDKKRQNRIKMDTNENVFYLASSARSNYDRTTGPFRWFKEVLCEVSHTSMLNFDETLKARFVKFLKYADESITGIAEDEILHKAPGNEIKIPLELESTGVKELFALLCSLFELLDKEKVMFADDPGKALHPLLYEYLIRMFNEDMVKSQLIFSTHNTYLLNPELLRRDQIWFCEKDIDDGATRLYSLLEFKQRNNANFEKSYLNGKYGAIPLVEARCEPGK